MRLGLFGGSFDPVHYGHLLLAESCREQCALDEVWFVPAAVPPHKQERKLSPGRQRVEMLHLATGGHAAFRVSTMELERGGVSYTADTLAELKQQRPLDELFFLLGADSLRDLPHWRSPEKICELAWIVAVARPHAPSPDFTPLLACCPAERVQAMQRLVVHMPLVELSSSDLRQRAASGHSLRYRTPAAVAAYIEAEGLYKKG